MYEVIFDPGTLEFLGKLDERLAKRIWDKIMSTKSYPYHFFERLVGRKDYRAIADINDSSKRIEVTLINHRRKVYKKI